MSLELDRPCPLCGDERSKPLAGLRAHHVRRCSSCGMVFAARTPLPGELEALYATYPLHATLNPITKTRYESLLREFASYRCTGKIIDVGSGSGFFLDVAHELGWEVHGTEYDPRVVEACRERGIRMREGPLDPANYEPGSFDVVTSFEVLEHLVAPLQELHSFSSLLRPGGALYLTTPNWNALSRDLAGRTWNIVNYPEHLNYFTAHTLRRALAETGFGKVRLRTTGISVSRIRSSRSEVEQANVDPGNDDQRLRRTIEGNPALRVMKELADSFLSATRKGDTLKVWAERTEGRSG